MLKNDHDLLYRNVEIEKLRKKHFFITGATGFLGLNLLESLVQLNQEFQLEMELTLLVRDQSRAAQLLARYGISSKSINFLESDLLNFLGVPYEYPEYDCIFHLAANTNLVDLREHPERGAKVIIEGTRNVLKLSTHSGCKNFIYLSSGAVYGKQLSDLSKIDEAASLDHGPLTSDMYGSSKVIAEQDCLQWSSEHGLKTTILRGFAFGGPHLNLDAHYAIGSLLQSAMKGDPIVVQDGATLRSYLYSVDAIIWILKAAFSEHPSHIFNLGSDQAVTIESLAQKISDQTGNKNIEIISRSTSPNRYVPNVDLAKKELGVGVYTTLDQIIHQMFEWNKQKP